MLLGVMLTALDAGAADWRDSPEGKLLAARQFVQKFLVDDANPKEVFFHRDVTFPAWKGQPLNDCAMQSFVRAIEQRGDPRFESVNKQVVLVPVLAELLLVEAQNGGGPTVRPGVEQYSWCSFAYERYNFATGQFEAVPSFRKRTHNDEFPSWGETLDIWRGHPLPPGISPDRYVAIDLDKRYVRYTIRVNVTKEQPYRLWPQVPRHWYGKDAIAKLERSNAERVDLLARGVSDQGSFAQPSELADDLNRMKHQLEEKRWVVKQLADQLRRLESIPPFSDIKPE